MGSLEIVSAAAFSIATLKSLVMMLASCYGALMSAVYSSVNNLWSNLPT